MPRLTKFKLAIAIILWIAITFFAIIKLPDANQVINQVNQPGQPQAQITGITRQQSRSTPVIDLVYSNHDRPITSHQQSRINHSLTRIRESRQALGIQKVVDLNTLPDGSATFKAPDQTIETAQLRINTHKPSHHQCALLKRQMKAKPLSTRFTAPELLTKTTTRRITKDTVAITIVSLVLASAAVGLAFHSVFLPIISLITLFTADIISLSLTMNLALKRLIGFNNLTPIAILLTTTVIGTAVNSLIYRQILQTLPKYRNVYNSTDRAIHSVSKPVLALGIIMTVTLCTPLAIPVPQLKALPALGITFLVLTGTSLVVTPLLTSRLGHELLWPSHKYQFAHHHRLWNRLASISLWKPVAGLVIVLYTAVPLAYSYHANANYSLSDYLPHNALQRGANQLRAHFTAGQSQPVIITLHSRRPFNSDAQLHPLDELTNKLQSMPGVKTVSSLTQPSGIPINKYYLRYQLSPINTDLGESQNQIDLSRKKLKTDSNQLGTKSLNQLTGRLSSLQKLTNQPNLHRINARGRLASQINALQRSASQLNGNLSQIKTQVGGMNHQLNRNRNQIQNIKKQLTITARQLDGTQTKLDTVYNYLNHLQKSAAGRDYYITPRQLDDTDFQQSLTNFTGGNNHTTRLRVIFNQAPSTRNNQSHLRRLKSEARTQLQGSELAAAKVRFSGQPVEQAQIHHGFKRGVILTLLIGGTVFILSLALISRSIWQPFGWIISLGLSFLAGLQLAELTLSYVTGQRQFNWQVLMVTSGIVLGITSLKFVPLSFSYRHRKTSVTDWIRTSFTQTGQHLRLLTSVIIISTVSMLLFGHEPEFAQTGLIITFTTLIFNLVLPLLTSAIVKLSLILPYSKI